MKTLEQEVKDRTDDKVKAARLAVRTASATMDTSLNMFPLQEHAAILASLQTMLQVRQQTMQLAMAEEQRQMQLNDQASRVKAFEQRQTVPIGPVNA